jgi:hypothetical protein
MVEQHIPMRRAGDADEMAAATAFLLSDDAAYITGQTLFVDGGLTLYPSVRSHLVVGMRPAPDRWVSAVSGAVGDRLGQLTGPMGWPSPKRLPSLSWNQAARSPVPLDG